MVCFAFRTQFRLAYVALCSISISRDCVLSRKAFKHSCVIYVCFLFVLQEIIEKFNIKEPLIKNRAPTVKGKDQENVAGPSSV